MVHQNQQQETAAVVLHAEVKMIHCIKGTVFHPEHTVKDFQSVHMSHYTPHIHNKFILVTSCCQKQIQKIHLTCFLTNCLVTALLKVIPHLTSGPYKVSLYHGLDYQSKLTKVNCTFGPTNAILIFFNINIFSYMFIM